jgi:adenylate cyclase
MNLHKVNIVAGLIVASFVLTHTINHALGLWSLEAAEDARQLFGLLWRNPIASWALAGALIVHLSLAYYSVFRRSHLRLPAVEWTRLAFAFLIPFVLVRHVTLSGIIPRVEGVAADYPFIIASMWLIDPTAVVLQGLLLIVVWGHLSIGFHFWLRHRAWYARSSPYLHTIAAGLVLLSLGGLARSVATVDRLARDPGWFDGLKELAFDGVDRGRAGALAETPPIVIGGLLVLLVAVLLARFARRWYRTRHGRIRVSYAGGRTVVMPVGATLLDASRTNGIPHASLCGGRGRCSTCRVKVTIGLDDLDPPEAQETRVLAGIKADADVRLACQSRPRRDVSVVPLLPANATAREAQRPGGLEGREQRVAILFIDLRGSTRLGERRLPYDVVHILSRFFAEMAEALVATKGHYAQFNGDGLMALYGLEEGFEEGCSHAIRGATEMLKRVDNLNETMKSELNEPLRVGIGIHGGEAIVGIMGPPTTPIISAIGDNVNVAARLESMTKEFGCAIVISEAVAQGAGLDLTRFPRHEAETRGRTATIPIYAVPQDHGLEL